MRKAQEKSKRMGWSFAAGSLFGALAILVPLASRGTAHSKPVALEQARAADLEPGGAEPVSNAVKAHAPEAVPSGRVKKSDSVRPAPARSGQKESRRTPGHSEFDLQLD